MGKIVKLDLGRRRSNLDRGPAKWPMRDVRPACRQKLSDREEVALGAEAAGMTSNNS
jgi:hypothetical protein